MNERDRDVDALMRAWQAPGDVPTGSPEAIVRHVKRRTVQLRAWLAGEVVVVVAVSPLLAQAALNGGVPERAAAVLLGTLALAALAFSWWNWRGTIAAAGASTSDFIALSAARAPRLSRAVAAGWALLFGEVVVFVWWLATREPAPNPWAWLLLAGLTVSGGLFLAALGRWARRECAAVETLAREIAGD